MLNPEKSTGWLIIYCELLRERQTPVTKEKTQMPKITARSNKLWVFNLELYSVF